MGRKKSDREKVVTSVYVDKSLKELTTKLGLSDSDLWELGAKSQLHLQGNDDILSKLLKIYQQDLVEAQQKVDRLSSKKGVIKVRDKGEDFEYLINPEDYNPDTMVKL